MSVVEDGGWWREDDGEDTPPLPLPLPPPPEPEPEPEPDPCWNCGAKEAPRDRRCTVCGSPRAHVVLLCADPCLELRHAAGRPLNLGRSSSWAPGTATAFADRKMVSKRHASVTVEPDGSAWVEEPPEGSRNHTFVNEDELKPGVRTPLRDGDLLRLGKAVVRFTVRVYGPES